MEARLTHPKIGNREIKGIIRPGEVVEEAEIFEGVCTDLVHRGLKDELGRVTDSDLRIT